ncbi:MAG: ribosome maturation factor RimM [Vicinamibacterales bacterium]
MWLVGVVARAQGNKGEVVVNATTDFLDERFAAGAELWCRWPSGTTAPLTVRSFRMHLGRPVLTLTGVATMTEAEALAGAELRVPSTARQALPADVYYVPDLVGCEVWTTAGRRVGPVVAVDGAGEATRLVVAGDAGEVLVPFAQAFCRVDVGARRIDITPPEGLLELNERPRREGR